MLLTGITVTPSMFLADLYTFSLTSAVIINVFLASKAFNILTASLVFGASKVKSSKTTISATLLVKAEVIATFLMLFGIDIL